VEHTDRDELRRLALWLSRRRAVDEAVGVLTAYGPAASDRVHAHLDALRQLLDAEREAFDAICAQAPPLPQLPLPELVEERVLRTDRSPGGRRCTPSGQPATGTSPDQQVCGSGTASVSRYSSSAVTTQAARPRRRRCAPPPRG
jgi:hypothetical protein